jgi:hypothetical protein
MIGSTMHLAPKPFGIACDTLLEITGGQNFGVGQAFKTADVEPR